MNTCTQLLIADSVKEFFFSVYDIYMPFYLKLHFMAYSPPYFSVNGIMILVWRIKMASKISQYILLWPIGKYLSVYGI